MNEYDVPTTEDVREVFCFDPAMYPAFSAWLNSIRADAWDAGWNAGYDDRLLSTNDREYQFTENPCRKKGTGL